MTNKWQGNFTQGSFFGANPNNPGGLQLEFVPIKTEDGIMVRAETSVEQKFEGPPGHVHGGISSAILDEAMGNVCFKNGYTCVSATQTTDWHRPTPLKTVLIIEAHIKHVEGKKVSTESKLMLEDGTILVSATGIYINRPDLFKKFAAALAGQEERGG
ncbi:MAG: acyl-coenzyme A thioesterase PaaI-like protein [Cellvibrionaceae bacterium]|jgi:acyl-coenzyme A thioesterase PaaI-like protein